jgi:hypothetical protein
VTGMRGCCLIPAIMALSPVSVTAQTSPIDQGAFTITRAGQPFGTESFLIVRSPSNDGAGYTLTSTRVVDGRTIRSSLKTDSAGGPITYMRQEVGASPVTLVASKGGGRLTVNFSEGGDRSSKDYLVTAGTLLVEDDLAHQLYFVCLKGGARPVSYVAPEAKTTATATLAVVADEAVELGNRARVDGRHFAFGTGAGKRDIWVDSSGRLLKVSIPGRQIEAVRDEPPR